MSGRHGGRIARPPLQRIPADDGPVPVLEFDKRRIHRAAGEHPARVALSIELL